MQDRTMLHRMGPLVAILFLAAACGGGTDRDELDALRSQLEESRAQVEVLKEERTIALTRVDELSERSAEESQRRREAEAAQARLRGELQALRITFLVFGDEWAAEREALLAVLTPLACQKAADPTGHLDRLELPDGVLEAEAPQMASVAEKQQIESVLVPLLQPEFDRCRAQPAATGE